jgi:hypothetical protein
MTLTCDICDSEFDLEAEGGIAGNFGIMPVQFCPWCLSCMIDMVNRLQVQDDNYDDYH